MVRKNADELLAAALAGGQTVAGAAEAAGVSERTAYRRLEDESFRARVQQLKGEAVARAVSVLGDGMTEAAARLRLLARSKDQRIALRACKVVLELGARLRESVELEERIADLERAQERARQGRKAS